MLRDVAEKLRGEAWDAERWRPGVFERVLNLDSYGFQDEESSLKGIATTDDVVDGGCETHLWRA
jgi:hypothetical protein